MTLSVIILCDQVTKMYVGSAMYLNESVEVVKGLFNITYVRNPGAAFGFLSNLSPVLRTGFFVTVSVAAIVFIIVIIRKIKDRAFSSIFSLSLILSGAIGNLIDRVRYGEVIDFLDFHLGPHHWPAFNIADSAISIGAVILILELVKRKDII